MVLFVLVRHTTKPCYVWSFGSNVVASRRLAVFKVQYPMYIAIRVQLIIHKMGYTI